MTELRQLERELDERVLERAEADPEWKRRYVEDPKGAVGDMPEAQRLVELEESVLPPDLPPPEATVVTPTEEHRELMQKLTEKVLDKAASDPLWKQRLLDDPEAAVREADLPEFKRLDEIRQEDEDVRGHFLALEGAGYNTGCQRYTAQSCCAGYTCRRYTS